MGKCVGEWGEVRNHVGRGVKGGMEMGGRCGEMWRNVWEECWGGEMWRKVWGGKG